VYLLYMPVGCGILCCYWRARVSCLSINLVSSWSYGTYLLCHTALTISLCTCLDYFSSCPPAEKGPSPGLCRSLFHACPVRGGRPRGYKPGYRDETGRVKGPVALHQRGRAHAPRSIDVIHARTYWLLVNAGGPAPT
jgi:hypothetical protein